VPISHNLYLDLDLEHILNASCASLVMIQPFVWQKNRFVQMFTNGWTDRRWMPHNGISSFRLEMSDKPGWQMLLLVLQEQFDF